MAQQRIMQRFARWHIWLAWLTGIPLVIWTLSGLVMVVQPIEQVRGEHLRAPPPMLEPGPHIQREWDEDLTALRLVQQPDGPAWIVTAADGGQSRYSARDGTIIPPVIEAEARRIAEQAYAGEEEIAAVTYFPADAAPHDLRRVRPSWQVKYADGTNFYIDDDTGEVLAVRTPGWRLYDFMWGLHIMDLETREDTSHPILILFAGLALLSSLIGTVLMFRRRKARVKA